MRAADLPLTVTVPEAGRLLGISRNLAYAGVHNGEIPSLHIGGRLLVPTAALLRMLGIEEVSPAAVGRADGGPSLVGEGSNVQD